MKDPRVAKDGRCAAKGCTKKRTIPAGRYATREQYEADPFCSATCCRKHYKVVSSTLRGWSEEKAENHQGPPGDGRRGVGRGRKGIGRV